MESTMKNPRRKACFRWRATRDTWHGYVNRPPSVRSRRRGEERRDRARKKGAKAFKTHAAREAAFAVFFATTNEKQNEKEARLSNFGFFQLWSLSFNFLSLDRQRQALRFVVQILSLSFSNTMTVRVTVRGDESRNRRPAKASGRKRSEKRKLMGAIGPRLKKKKKNRHRPRSTSNNNSRSRTSSPRRWPGSRRRSPP